MLLIWSTYPVITTKTFQQPHCLQIWAFCRFASYLATVNSIDNLSMGSRTLLFVTLSLLSVLHLPSSTAQNVVKSAYWFAGSEFPVSDIDSTLFTHLICAFADLDPQTSKVVVKPDNVNRFSTFTQTVQRRNPLVKTILSIGGGSANRADYAAMASQVSSRKAFIDSSISLARSYGFHGIDLDWEYPSTPTEMGNFGQLCTQWRAAIDTEARNTGRTRLLLGAAVFYSSDYYSLFYPVQAVRNSLDFINVMAYDFYGPRWSNITGPPAALYNPGSRLSGDSGIKAWIQSGMPANKIVLGFPYYGYAWNLANPGNHGYFAPTTGKAISDDGSIGYKQIRQFIVQNKARTVYNSTVVGAYSYAGTTWIGYDDRRTIIKKVKYAKDKRLLGYFAWHVANDDNWELSRAASQTWGRTVAVPEDIPTMKASF